MGADGDDPSALEQHDPVGQGDGGEPVGHDDRGAVGRAAPVEGVVDRLLDVDVDRAGGVVEHQDAGVDQDVRAMAMRWRWPPESV